MTPHSTQGLVTRRKWTEDELAEAENLINACNAYEDLYIKLPPALLRSRPGNTTDDFLYYADGRLVGLLSLDDFPKEDREMTGVVHPDYRRRGIFTSLLNAAKVEGKARGLKRFVIVCERTSRSGVAFVEAIGAALDSSEYKMILRDFRPREKWERSEGRIGREEKGNGRIEGEDGGNEGGEGRNELQPLLEIVPVTSDDIPDAARVIAASFRDDEERTRQHLAEELRNPHVHYYVARLGSEPVSALNVYFGDQASAGIYAFGVMPEYRGQGFGRQMLERIIMMIQAEAPERRIDLEVDTSNSNAIALYRSCGFREVTTYGYYNLDLN